MTIKDLKKLDVDKKMKDHPVMAKSHPDAITPYNYHQKDTNGLTRCIIDAINFTGGFAVRVNNGGTFRKGKKIPRECGGYVVTPGVYTFNGTRGVADIDATWQGMKVAIEVKFGKDRLSDDQINYKEAIIKGGGYYIVAKEFEEFWRDFEAVKLTINQRLGIRND